MSVYDISDHQFKKIYLETRELKKQYNKKNMELLSLNFDSYYCLKNDMDVELALKLFRAKQNEDGTKFAVKHNQLEYLDIAPEYLQEKYKNHEVHVIKDIATTFIKDKLSMGMDFLFKNNYESLFLVVVDYCILGNIYTNDFEVVGRIREKTQYEKQVERFVRLNSRLF
ncbi:hypothetical protein [Vagococcus fluvialis]|uniref:Uncharacterized protein n=1 Tax=Vagococcus fluvialis TaxID=2738 RepID=A0A7X6DAB8_9ENTE|nr:hypothetical protein [Vagococcus fluvialis]NKC68563.1 hypothetical protein [Vagococcus fluvialis]